VICGGGFGGLWMKIGYFLLFFVLCGVLVWYWGFGFLGWFVGVAGFWWINFL
jgi:hypothetical protein